MNLIMEYISIFVLNLFRTEDAYCLKLDRNAYKNELNC